MAKIAVCIISCNTRDLLQACLLSVTQENPGEIVVVDNASQDGSPEMVEAEFPSVILRKNAHNPGYGTASNQAIAGCTAPYILLLNSDTLLEQNALEPLSKYLDQNPQVAVAGPALVGPDGKRQISCFPYPTPLELFLDTSNLTRIIGAIPVLRDRYLRTWSHTQIRSVPWVSGAALAIRRAAFEAIGGFDELFFMYSEEVDLCYRLKNEGWEIHYAPVTETTHIGGASTQQQRADMLVQFYASLAQFYRRHYSIVRFLELFLLIEFIALARLIRDRLLLLLDQDIRKRKSLSQNIVAWYRLLYGDWRKHRPDRQGLTC
jgi:GT2 family glycosyltransferase